MRLRRSRVAMPCQSCDPIMLPCHAGRKLATPSHKGYASLAKDDDSKATPRPRPRASDTHSLALRAAARSRVLRVGWRRVPPRAPPNQYACLAHRRRTASTTSSYARMAGARRAARCLLRLGALTSVPPHCGVFPIRDACCPRHLRHLDEVEDDDQLDFALPPSRASGSHCSQCCRIGCTIS